MFQKINFFETKSYRSKKKYIYQKYIQVRSHFNEMSNNVNNKKESDIIFANLFKDNDKLSMQGFNGIKNFLNKVNTDQQIKLSLGDDNITEGLTRTLNPYFYYENKPLQGWRKEISVRLNGKTRGSIDVCYLSPNKTKRIRNKGEFMNYCTKESNLASPSSINQFDFRNVFCVCHTTEDVNRSYIECSFGKCGCNGWIHSDCVGLGLKCEEDLIKLKKVFCPFCTHYLDSVGLLKYFNDIM
jgi:hypothetical protein